jgi:hypothetical protein
MVDRRRSLGAALQGDLHHTAKVTKREHLVEVITIRDHPASSDVRSWSTAIGIPARLPNPIRTLIGKPPNPEVASGSA